MCYITRERSPNFPWGDFKVELNVSIRSSSRSSRILPIKTPQLFLEERCECRHHRRATAPIIDMPQPRTESAPHLLLKSCFRFIKHQYILYICRQRTDVQTELFNMKLSSERAGRCCKSLIQDGKTTTPALFIFCRFFCKRVFGLFKT